MRNREPMNPRPVVATTTLLTGNQKPPCPRCTRQPLLTVTGQIPLKAPEPPLHVRHIEQPPGPPPMPGDRDWIVRSPTDHHPGRRAPRIRRLRTQINCIPRHPSARKARPHRQHE